MSQLYTLTAYLPEGYRLPEGVITFTLYPSPSKDGTPCKLTPVQPEQAWVPLRNGEVIQEGHVYFENGLPVKLTGSFLGLPFHEGDWATPVFRPARETGIQQQDTSIADAPSSPEKELTACKVLVEHHGKGLEPPQPAPDRFEEFWARWNLNGLDQTDKAVARAAWTAATQAAERRLRVVLESILNCCGADSVNFEEALNEIERRATAALETGKEAGQ